MKYPTSPYDKTHGLYYFARMIDKIRLAQTGELPPDYQANLGTGMDGRLTRFLHVDYAALVERVKSGTSDEELFEWCQQTGKRLIEEEIAVWNGFISKRGWKDEATAILQKHKESSGLAHRTDLETFFEFFEVDEKRKP